MDRQSSNPATGVALRFARLQTCGSVLSEVSLMPTFEAVGRVRPPNERMRLEAFYAEKNDEELLSLLVGYQTLTEVAQGALHDELNKRRLWFDRPNQEPETSTKPLKDRENFSGVLRKGGFLEQQKSSSLPFASVDL